MAINKKLITFDKKASFLGANGTGGATTPTNGYYGQIPSTSIVFILDTGELWTHGKFICTLSGYTTNTDEKGASGILHYDKDDATYYISSHYLWGNKFDGTTSSIDGELKVNDKWVYGYSGTYGRLGYYNTSTKTTTDILTFASTGAVTIPYSLEVSSKGISTINTTNGTIIAAAYLKGAYLYNTKSYLDTSLTLGLAWNSIQMFNSDNSYKTSISTSKPAFITAQKIQSSNTDWIPWIAGASTDYASWGIGVGDTSFYIGRISKDQTANALSQYWKFDTTGITFSGTTKYITASGVTDSDKKVYAANGSLLNLTDIYNNADLKSYSWDPTIKPGISKTWSEITALDLPALIKTTGTYAIKILYGTSLYSGVATIITDSTITTSDEVLLHECGSGNQGHLYLKIGPRATDNKAAFFVATSEELEDYSFSINLRQLL